MCGKGKKRVLFLNHWSQHLGGAELSLLDILQYYAKGAQTCIVCSENGSLLTRAKELGVSVHVIPCPPALMELRRHHLLFNILKGWKTLPGFIMYLYKLRRFVTFYNPDCIHANVPKSHMALFFLARLGFHHAAIFHIREIFRSCSLPWYLYRFLFPAHGRAIAISNAVMRTLPNNIKMKTTVIYNGIQIPDSIPNRPLRKSPRFLYLGRVVPWKGCHLLLEAFSILVTAKKERAGTLDFIGGALYWDEHYRNNLMQIISSLNLENRIKLLPHTHDIAEAFRSHDILCMASNQEPFGRVAAEAQAFGLPVIGFDSGGLPEIVENRVSGILVPDGSVKELAAAMTFFIEQPRAIAEFGNAGRKFARNAFDKNRQIELISEYLYTAIEDVRPKAHRLRQVQQQ